MLPQEVPRFPFLPGAPASRLMPHSFLFEAVDKRKPASCRARAPASGRQKSAIRRIMGY
jgi:hypothetical protein